MPLCSAYRTVRFRSLAWPRLLGSFPFPKKAATEAVTLLCKNLRSSTTWCSGPENCFSCFKKRKGEPESRGLREVFTSTDIVLTSTLLGLLPTLPRGQKLIPQDQARDLWGQWRGSLGDQMQGMQMEGAWSFISL